MKDLDQLIENAVSSRKKSTTFNVDSFLDLIYEVISEQKLNEKGPLPASVAAKDFDAGAAKDTQKLKQSDGDKSGAGLLDISNISRMLIRGTESDNRLQSVNESFNTIRTLNPHLKNLSNSSGGAFVDELIKAINYYFSPPKDLIDNPCTGIGNLMSRQLILDAYLSIFKEYNSQSAGFVNENYLAGLLGGKTIPAEGGTNIADFKLGDIGVSLKTSQYKGKLSGSFKNLLRTLGVKFRIPGSSTSNDSDIPANPGGLYYLLFNKKENSHMITAFRVNKEEIVSQLEDEVPVDDEGYFVFKNTKQFNDLAKKVAPMLGADYKTIFNTSVPGISDLKTSEKEIQTELPQVQDSHSDNAKKVIETLNALNEFYSIYSNAVLKFATDPSYENLEDLKNSLQTASQFDPQLLASDKC